ncbi:hypothetical protein FALCPG4_011482 [Fusarium falciforme]
MATAIAKACTAGTGPALVDIIPGSPIVITVGIISTVSTVASIGIITGSCRTTTTTSSSAPISSVSINAFRVYIGADHPGPVLAMATAIAKACTASTGLRGSCQSVSSRM